MKSTALKDIFERPISGEWGYEPQMNKGQQVGVLRTTNFSKDIRFKPLSEIVTREIDSIKIQQKKLRFGDIIIEKSGGGPTQPVGRVLFYDVSSGTNLCNNFTSILRVKNGYDSKFMAYSLHHLYKTGVVLKFQNKTTGIINLKLDRYLKFTKVQVPPLETQKRIVAVLDRAQALIDRRKQQLALMDELTQSLFYDMFGDPVTNPMGWETQKMDYVCDRIVDCPHSTPKWKSKGIVCLRTSNLGYGDWDWNDTRYVDDEQYRIRTYRSEINPEDIILSREGTVGVAAIVPEDTKLCLGQRLVQVRPQPEVLTSEYLLKVLLSKLSPDMIQFNMAGSTSKHLNMKDLRKMIIPVPSLEIQALFEKYSRKVRTQKQAMTRSLREMEDNFNALMQRAFKGEL